MKSSVLLQITVEKRAILQRIGQGSARSKENVCDVLYLERGLEIRPAEPGSFTVAAKVIPSAVPAF